MAKRQTFTREKVEEIREYFKGLPEIEKPKAAEVIQKTELIAELKTEIKALLSRGYTMEMIVQAFSGKGVGINSVTIKSYLSRSKVSRKKKAKAVSDSPVVATTETVTPATGAVKQSAQFAIEPDSEKL